jgi:NAD(P)-dependent dehydrogenase (short-subunit alcohol dehydrogenase family)
MTWNTSDIPDLTGTTAVVTGGNGGLGLASSRALAGAGAHVIMAARDQAKAATASADIMSERPDASLEVVELDLGSLEQVHAAASTITDRHRTIDILMNNAGVMALPERRTVDGFEMQFGVNHLGHWVLTADLMPALVAADAARVVTVTSTAHLYGKIVDPENLNMDDDYDPWRAYGRSKLANFHFAIGLQREFERHGMATASLAAHPGLSRTNLQVNTVHHGGGGPAGPFFERLAAWTGMSPDNGARSQLRAATDPTASGGEFYGPLFGNNGPPVRKPIVRRDLEEGIATLWEVSEQATGVTLDVDGAVAR